MKENKKLLVSGVRVQYKTADATMKPRLYIKPRR